MSSMSGPVDGGDRRCYTTAMTLRVAVSILLAASLCVSVATRAIDAPACAKASAGKQTSGAAAVQLKREQILEQQLKPLAKPASAPAGQKLYDVLCAMCHRFGSIGQDVGPDLTTVTSRFGRKELLESILWPSRTISDQYESELFETVNGKVHHGLLVRETADGPADSHRRQPQAHRPRDCRHPVAPQVAAVVHARSVDRRVDASRTSPICSRSCFAGPPKSSPAAR